MAASRPTPPLRSPLGRAIGLGSAKEGVNHWWAERIGAVALVPLTVWFVIAIIGLAGADRDAFVGWLHHPVPAVLLILLIATTLHHSALGLQVVIEDYVEGEGVRFTLLILNKLLSIVLAALGIFAVLKLSFAG